MPKFRSIQAHGSARRIAVEVLRASSWPRILSLLLLLALSPLATAIVTRHDIDDLRYQEIGQQLNGLCHLNLQQGAGPPDGEGTLIHPRWILTAAHVAEQIKQGHVITVTDHENSVSVAAEAIFVKPEWHEGPHDIALIRLAHAVRKIKPVPLYRGRDEQGKLVVIGGLGDSGTGITGPIGNDGKLRVATNRIDEVSGNWLKFRFDEPATATDFEGVSGPGDSGGPALLTIDGTRYLAGISAGQATEATGGREGLYGVYEYYTRVSSYLDWIDATLENDASAE